MASLSGENGRGDAQASRAGRATQPAREQNVAAIRAYFLSGIKPADRPGRIGIELEHTLVREGNEPVPYSGPGGVAEILERLSEEYPYLTRDEEGDLLGVARPGEAITIEPAAQLELSAGPFSTMSLAKSTFEGFEATLSSVLDPLGASALTVGYHPSARALDLELIPKERYRFMHDYLSRTDECGPCMMRGSASTQVSIDYFSEADCLRKLCLAFACVPLFSLITDNAPVFEGAPRTCQLVRTHIWNHMDADRSGVVPGALDPAFTLEDYASVILDMPAILVKDAQSGRWVADARSFGEIYAEEPMGRDEVEHALSMSFTDVRLKTYLEIRPGDAMPLPYALAYAALVKGLFYSEASLAALDALFEGVREADVAQAKESLMESGYEGRVYGRPVAALCDRLIELGSAGLPEGERSFLAPLADLVARRTTLAML